MEGDIGSEDFPARMDMLGFYCHGVLEKIDNNTLVVHTKQVSLI